MSVRFHFRITRAAQYKNRWITIYDDTGRFSGHFRFLRSSSPSIKMLVVLPFYLSGRSARWKLRYVRARLFLSHFFLLTAFLIERNERKEKQRQYRLLGTKIGNDSDRELTTKVLRVSSLLPSEISDKIELARSQSFSEKSRRNLTKSKYFVWFAWAMRF